MFIVRVEDRAGTVDGRYFGTVETVLTSLVVANGRWIFSERNVITKIPQIPKLLITLCLK